MSDADAPTPALYDHAKRVYEEMVNRGRREIRHDVEGGQTITDDDYVNVYEGHLTKLFNELGIANPYYTKIRDALVAQGCIEQLRRGGGQAFSKWVLVKWPEESTFRSFMERNKAPKGKVNVLEQQVKDMRRMIQDQATATEMQETRITILERKLEKAGLK